MKKIILVFLTVFSCATIFAQKKQELKYIGMPVGGICAGQVYLGGDGQLWNWDIFNVMATVPGNTAGDTYYLNPLTQEQTFVNGFGITVRKGKQLHHRSLNSDGFSDIEFEGDYPIGRVTYNDKYMPVKVELEAYSPFIPTDAEDSGLPITVLEYTVTNTEDVDVEVEIAGWMQNMSLFQTAKGKAGEHVNRTVKTDDFVRVVMDSKSQGLKETQADWGGMTLTLLGDGVASAECGKMKGIPTCFVDAKNTVAEAIIGEPLVGGVSGKAIMKAGESKKFTFLISWYFPNIHLWDGGHHMKNRDDLRYYYSSKFSDAAAVADYVIENPKVMDNTKLWVETWNDSSLPNWFLDRTFINVSTLATTAAVRFDDLKDSAENEGRFYTSEGVYLGEGTCTHVFHYEQAMGRVFPTLARQLREQVDLGLSYGYKEDGIIGYRGEFSQFGSHDGRGYAVDGQAGTILRIYREHLMSTDKKFITSNWANIKGAMQYMIAQDKHKTGIADGILEGIQYNTLDRMWYGKIAWTSGLYAAALRASAEMADEVGDKKFAKECAKIANLAYANISGQLFDGEYFIQITDPEHPEAPNTNKGCHIDQLLGQYWASQLGLGHIVPEKQVKSALKSIVKYNFIENYNEFLKGSEIPISRWYADEDESGLIMCSFPKGGADLAPGLVKNDWEKLVVGYFSEMWTGQEHAVAAALIDEGLIEEAMKVEKALHNRYSAEKRNPYNEIEYGNHYTRAMSGFAPFVSASGFYYHGSKGIIGFDPKMDADSFKSAFITGEGWGSFAQNHNDDNQEYVLALKYGQLAINTLKLSSTTAKIGTFEITLNNIPMKAKYSVKDGVLEIKTSDIQLKAGDVIIVKTATEN